jgi:hypothetical protein
VIASAALLAAAGTGALVVAPASAASTALPVGLSGINGGSAHYNPDGSITLSIGQPSWAADARVYVDLPTLGNTSAPQTPPSFTVDNYAGGDPRWEIMLSDDVPIYGYPAQIGGTANASFTGAQWTVGYSGTTDMTYQQALAQADPGGTAHVTGAVIDDYGSRDGGQPNSETLTNVQYDGETPKPGVVTVAPVAAQTLGAGVAAPPVQVHASTTILPSNVGYTDNGTLPAGLTIDSVTGVISGYPTAVGTSTATITAGDVAGETASVQISYTVNPTAAWACQLSTGCSWQELDDPSTMVMDVSGQIPSTGAAIIAYAPAPGDPAADFTAVPSGFGSSQQLRYTPYGTLKNAEYLDATLAADAYNANGSAKYCVSSVADISGQALQLRPCATVANKWQDFVSGGTAVGGTMIEPTYGTPGVSAGSNPMAINDRAYGGDGTPLINYAATDSTNERFKPGV